MSPAGYFSCAGCGQLFSLYNKGIEEYEHHDCERCDIHQAVLPCIYCCDE